MNPCRRRYSHRDSSTSSRFLDSYQKKNQHIRGVIAADYRYKTPRRGAYRPSEQTEQRYVNLGVDDVFNGENHEEDNPYRNLWLTVVLQAVSDVIHGMYRATPKKHERQAAEWIASESKEPCTFLWVCLCLDIDPDAIRKRLEDCGAITTRPSMSWDMRISHYRDTHRKMSVRHEEKDVAGEKRE